jgi:hypothetical protein
MNFTPAALAALMTFWCCVARWPTSLEEISRSLSTPFSAVVNRCLVGIIRLTHDNTLLAQCPAFAGLRNGHNLVGRNGFQQVFNNEMAKLAGSAGNCDHDELLRVCLVLWHTITNTNF